MARAKLKGAGSKRAAPSARARVGKPAAKRAAKAATKKATTKKKPAAKRARAPRGNPTGVHNTLYVCRSCVWTEAERERDGKRQGTFLLEAVQDVIAREPLPAGMSLRAVFCLNGCKSPCNVAFRAPGKEGLRFSRMTPDRADDVVAFARAYWQSADGEVQEDKTPEAMRGKITVRTPPPPIRR